MNWTMSGVNCQWGCECLGHRMSVNASTVQLETWISRRQGGERSEGQGLTSKQNSSGNKRDGMAPSSSYFIQGFHGVSRVHICLFQHFSRFYVFFLAETMILLAHSVTFHITKNLILWKPSERREIYFVSMILCLSELSENPTQILMGLSF